MKKKALRKDFFVEIKRTYTRFLSIFGIVALGVAFYSGMRSTESDMLISADTQYDETALMDIEVFSGTGFSEQDIEELNKIEEIEYATGAYSTDVICLSDESQTVVKVLSYTENINKIDIIEGSMPKASNECVVDSFYMEFMEYEIGDIVIFEDNSNKEMRIVGSFSTSRYLSMDKGSTTIGDGNIDGVAIVNEEYFNLPVYTEVYIIAKDSKTMLCYSDEYRDYIDKVEENAIFSNWIVADRNLIQTYVEYESDAEKIGNIAVVFPIIFFLVAALVSLTTMTRMVEEQRIIIGTYKAIGYSKLNIAMKYIMYAFLATITASLIGGYIGSKLLPWVIMNTYKMMYPNLYVMLTPINKEYFLSAGLLAVFCVVAATFAACYKELLSSPSQLMRPAAPKDGKRVLIEKIPIIWNRLNFTWKSTVRNFLRYKKRLFMTLFGISGCMALLLVGFGLKDSINSIVGSQYGDLHSYDGIISITNPVQEQEMIELENVLKSESSISEFTMSMQGAVETEYNKESVSSYFFVPEDFEEMRDYIKIRDRESGENIKYDNESVLISEKMSKLLGAKTGDTIKIRIGNSETYEVKVGGIFENYVYHYVFMTKDLYNKIFGKQPEYNQIFLKTNGNINTVEANLSEKLLAQNGVGGVSFIHNIKDKFSDMMGSLDIIIVVLVVSAAGLAFIVLYNLNNINISERKRELATLKVLGFYDLELSRYVYRENIVITIIGIFIGCIFGVFLHRYIITTAEVNMVMFGRSIYLLSYIKSILLTLMFSFIVNFSMHFKLKKIDMTTSLKSVE